jgi:hypothetical protein
MVRRAMRKRHHIRPLRGNLQIPVSAGAVEEEEVGLVSVLQDADGLIAPSSQLG